MHLLSEIKEERYGFFCFANVLDLFTVLFETVMCYVLQWLSSHCSIFMPPRSGRHLALHLLFGLLTWGAWHSGHCFLISWGGGELVKVHRDIIKNTSMFKII